LKGIRQADGPEASQHRVDDDDCCADQDAFCQRETERLAKGLAGTLELCGDVRSQRERGDRRCDDDDGLPPRTAHWAGQQLCDGDGGAPVVWLRRRSPGATTVQLSTKPPTQAGNNQSAPRPQPYAAPLTPSNVQADEELAAELIAATVGPSCRAPRKKSSPSWGAPLREQPDADEHELVCDESDQNYLVRASWARSCGNRSTPSSCRVSVRGGEFARTTSPATGGS